MSNNCTFCLSILKNAVKFDAKIIILRKNLFLHLSNPNVYDILSLGGCMSKVNISDLDVLDSYEAEEARTGNDVRKVESARKEPLKSLLATIYETHEADELADAKMREEAREGKVTEKTHPLTSVWEAVEADEKEEFNQSL